MILHTINKSNLARELWQQVEACVRAGDSVLLIEDGVTACLADSYLQSFKSKTDVRILALADDIEARGLLPVIPEFVTLISYESFVDLACKHEKTISWY